MCARAGEREREQAESEIGSVGNTRRESDGHESCKGV